MHSRRLVKRSILGSRVYAPSPTGDGAPVTGVVQAVKQDNRDVSSSSSSSCGARRSVYTVLLQDGTLREFSEEDIAAAGFNHSGQAAKGAPLKSNLKVSSNGAPDSHKVEGFAHSPEAAEEHRTAVDGRRAGRDPDARSVSLLEQKRKVVSSSIDVPHAR
ncbi:zinc finger protein 704 [Nelusetta ayraudi]|uniref:zinc finger protein 704 n=1 Tax=Nelusetta ayraudi TaxID=303726 RepID=UPI003F717C5D